MHALKFSSLVFFAASLATAWEIRAWTGVECAGSEIYDEATTGTQACENFDTTKDLHSVKVTYAKKNVVPHIFYEEDCKGTVYVPRTGICLYDSSRPVKSYKIMAAS
ncbi:hypothetical protein ASPCADRAFT_9144 [Aspergillus carbonarius ITEM 5010]|uniref:Uncharacterized protein n=1 Tax=Aspergillus carbonarius (strain ITEM 5010) TaxID=602072 RepID=A0A1R3RB57_ASPC5|nr:hypothetical protein ASPCADRAFT_408859 [Aspergillus carbonarius ITEM 5010]OOF91723.1 hypothetical protein ASPCADRAFT_9144 [Aspergillus carbonarius ITEM 5010]